MFSATWEAEIRRVTVQGQHGQKASETPFSINKPGMVLHACGPSYKEGIGRRIIVQASLVKT
jgi:hypothetical protein